jgi:hypothetical protein
VLHGSWSYSDIFDAIFGAIAFAFDDGGFTSVEQPIEDSGGGTSNLETGGA